MSLQEKSFINPASDLLIAWLFGKPENNSLLLDFVNAVLKDADFVPVKALELRNPFSLRNFQMAKQIVLDIKAISETGETVNIEVQMAGNEDFIHRSLYYWAKVYTEQLESGEDYKQLKPVICINLLGFRLFKDNPSLHNCFMLCNIRDKENLLTEHLVLHFI